MSTMRLLFEEESGSSTGRRHPHNGYYAGDFSGRGDATVAPAILVTSELSLRLLVVAASAVDRAAELPSERAA